MMPQRVVRYLLQGLNYAVFMFIVWYFSTAPAVDVLSRDEAVLTIAFSHAGELREPCRRLSQEELAQLAKNMRTATDCPRARSPVAIRAKLDQVMMMDAILEPPGLFDDGGVDVYRSVSVPAGLHHFEIEMADSVLNPGFNHRFSEDVSIEPGQILLVRFESGRGFFISGRL